MSDELKQFEKLLGGQPLRQVPAEWRNEILSAAEKAQPARKTPSYASRSWLSLFGYRLRSLLWPHPVAWAGLAAVWIFILGADISMQDQKPVMAKKVLPPSPEVVAELKQQHQLLAELMGTSDTPAADRPKIFAPKPRSECAGIMTA